ncbi:MAG: OadG family protein [Lachnospiraceae bacterium]
MKKKISLIIGMCLIVLGLTACGQADPTKVDYNGYTYQQLQDGCQKMATALESLSSEELQQYKTAEDELMVNLVTRWEEARTDVGDFAGMGEFKITKSGKTLTCEQEIKYEQRPVILTYVYNAKSMELEDVTVDQVKTLGEKMENAALNTLLGMGTVFAVLILISLIISCFRIFPYLEKKKQAKNVAEVETAPVTAILEQQDDLELAAVIAAAVAASTGTSTEDFVVRSIKRRF